ncbi:unnamed protein product [Durusdinium trenchii]|uniref:Poly [ADP-ribose] polymerase n=1 Tax=Durusdinium trenchii TaxID=1381693 RepID=A0ABP0QGH9_9DINO
MVSRNRSPKRSRKRSPKRSRKRSCKQRSRKRSRERLRSSSSSSSSSSYSSFHQRYKSRELQKEQRRRPAAKKQVSALQEKEVVGSAADITVVKCANKVVESILRGTFSVNGQNHGRPIYKKDADTVTVLLYYWDERDGPKFCGWWFGPKVGGEQVWAFHPASTLTPPKTGWRLPWDGPVDSSFCIEAKVAEERKREDHIKAHQDVPSGSERRKRPLSPTQQHSEAQTGKDAIQKGAVSEVKRRSSNSDVGSQSIGQLVGQMVDKELSKLQEALASEKTMREAAEGKLRDASLSLESREGALASEQRELAKLQEALASERAMRSSKARDCQSLERALASEREKLQAAEEQVQAKQIQIDELTACLAEQKRIKSMASSCGARWQYKENECWHAVPPEANDQMHQAYLAYLRDPISGNRCRTINSAGVAREVDFELMQQKRGDTNKVRQIRILPGVPKQWVSTPASLLQQTDQLNQFYIEVTDDQILEQVIDILQLTGHAQTTWQGCSWLENAGVISVHRIENFRLWHGYKQRCEALRKQNASHNVSVAGAALDLDASDGSTKVMTSNQKVLDCGEALAADVDEKILLHGTSWENANSIILNGFDHRTCSRGMYGDGVYFASAACKSHHYTCKDHKMACGCKRERTLIIARVALGDAYYAKETRYKERRPPVRDSTSGVTYDSVVVNPGRIKGHHNTTQLHQEFVISDREQAYPCYVVQYRL